MVRPVYAAAACIALLAQQADAGGYAAPVIDLPVGGSASAAQQMVSICTRSPEACAAAVLALLAVLAVSGGGGNDVAIIRPVDPTPEPPIVDDCTLTPFAPECDPQTPVGPGPGDPTAAVPLVGALAGMTTAVAFLGGMAAVDRRRRIRAQRASA